MDTNISAGDRHLKKLKNDGESDQEIPKIFSMLISAKREAALHKKERKKERKECNKAINYEFQSIQMSVDLAKHEKLIQSEGEKDAARVEAMLARFSSTTTTATDSSTTTYE
jgi:predicted lipase